MSTNGPETRIGDAEREAAVTALGEHYAAGRLTKEEYDERAGQAFAARTASGLWPLFADLPRPQSTRPATSPQASARDGGGRQGWRFGAWMVPVLVVLLAMMVFTHLPWFLLLILVWVVLAKSSRHWSHRRGPRGRW